MNQRNYAFVIQEVESIIRHFAAILWSVARLIWGPEITEARKNSQKKQGD